MHHVRNVHDPVPAGLRRGAVDRFAGLFAERVGHRPGMPVAPLFERLGGRYAQDLANFGFGGPDRVLVTPAREMRVEDRFTTLHGPDAGPLAACLAEAIGHLCLHYPLVVRRHGSGAAMAVPRHAGSDPDLRQAVAEALWFAAALLMPAEAFVEAALAGADDAELGRRFRVEPGCAARRRNSLAHLLGPVPALG